MRKARRAVWARTAAVMIFSLALLAPKGACGEDQAAFEKALWLYQHENYEEALAAFTALEKANPSSAETSFYLGMTYKKMQDYLEAVPHLEAAASARPPFKAAIPELIDALYQVERIDDAERWLGVAEKEGVAPAQIKFFQGLIGLKRGTDIDATVRSLDEAVRLDASLEQPVKYYKALALMQAKEYKDAREIFKEIVVKEPGADLALFANEYMDILQRREDMTKPFRAIVNYAIQYDDNVILKPNDSTLSAGVGGNKGDWRQVITAQGEFNAKPVDWAGVKGGYAFYGAKQFDLGFYDTMSHDFYVQPALYFNNVAVSFPSHYDYITVNDKEYLDLVGVSNLNNIMVGRKDMAQTLFQYNRKNYVWPVTRDDENRDSQEFVWAVGWYRFFGKNNGGFVNARYAINYEGAKGNNWTYLGNRITLSALVPLVDKLKWGVSGDYFRQDFEKHNTVYDKDRTDDIFTVSNVLSYEVIRGFEIQAQHMYADDVASIGIYRYRRNVYSLGGRYQF